VAFAPWFYRVRKKEEIGLLHFDDCLRNTTKYPKEFGQMLRACGVEIRCPAWVIESWVGGTHACYDARRKDSRTEIMFVSTRPFLLHDTNPCVKVEMVQYDNVVALSQPRTS
jgi:hypothetical protein